VAGRLDGKVAVITGGGSGIGRACAVRFAQEGAAVCVADLKLEGAAETAHGIEAAGGKAIAVELDTSDEAANHEMVKRCVEAFGGVDVTVAAAGIGTARPASEQGSPRYDGSDRSHGPVPPGDGRQPLRRALHQPRGGELDG